MSDKGQAGAGDELVERLLTRAAIRPAPPADEEQRIRAAVHAEWQRQLGRRRHLRLSVIGLAATLVAGAMLAFHLLTPDGRAPVEVAQLERQFGAVYLVHDDAGLEAIGNVAALEAGQTVQTARDAGLAFRLVGASVRLGGDSRLQIAGRDDLYLERGRVYVDAPPEKPDIRLVVRTDLGSVVHRGTQFMVAIAGDELTVSVREGEVSIDGRYYDAQAAVGDRVTLRGTNRPAVDRIAAHGVPWRWMEALAPRQDVDGMPADRFLAWVGGETGYRIVFGDDEARVTSGATLLKGVVDESPRRALELRLLTMGLDYDIDDARGEIRIRTAGR